MKTHGSSTPHAHELFGRYSFDKLSVRLKLSRQIPRRAPRNLVTKRGTADLTLHNLLAISHRELERHQVDIILNGLATRSSSPLKDREVARQRTPACRRPSCGRVASLTGFPEHLSIKKAGIAAGPVQEHVNRGQCRGQRCAITAEAVVDAQGDLINVLGDPIVEYAYEARVSHGEGVVCISHPQMIVFSADRPK